MVLNKKSKQKGFSLLELLLVVAVGAILILSGLAVYQNVTNNQQVTDATRLLSTIRQETQKLYQGETSYGAAGTDITSIVVNADAAPQKYLNAAGDDLESPFDSAINIVAQDSDFDIEMEDVPQQACLKLGVTYKGDDADFVSISIGGNNITDPTVASINAACDEDTDSNDMIWRFE